MSSRSDDELYGEIPLSQNATDIQQESEVHDDMRSFEDANSHNGRQTYE
jgi:hypothetical protein